MAQSLLQLRNRLRRWLHETVASESFFTDAFLNNLINAAYRRRVSQQIMAYEGDYTLVATRSVVAQQANYAWPAGLVRLRRLDFVTTDGTRIPVQRFERHTDITNPTSVEPYFFRPTNNGFIIEPTPQDSIGSWRLEYQVTPALLEADGDTLHTDFPELFDELIILDAVVAALDSEGVLEDGLPKSALRARNDLEWDFNRWIDGKIVKKQDVVPFITHYMDA